MGQPAGGMDEEDLRASLEQHHAESYGWAMCCCYRDPARAEEALQQTYLKVLQGKARYQGRGVFKTWLFAVIRRTAADQRRKESLRRIRLVRHLQQANEPIAQPAHDATQDATDLRNVFVAALDTLPARQRQVLHLLFYHGLTLVQAAEVMQVSIGSVRTHYDRGKEALRKRLQEQRDDDAGRRTNSNAVR